jgi:hypothetical protein
VDYWLKNSGSANNNASAAFSLYAQDYDRWFEDRIGEVVTLIERSGLMVEGFSSTLTQLPLEMPYPEPARHGLVEDAGFVCIRATRADEKRD